MRDYKELYREANGDLPRIYVDMDGVLCDFILAAKRATGQDWTGLRTGQDWDSIRKTKNYWANMPWTRDGKQLWSFLSRHKPHILSAYSIEDPNCIPGKMKWLRKEVGYTQKFMINIVRRREKKEFAMKGSKERPHPLNKKQPAILIDDFPKNVQQFKANGGIGILHTSASNTISQLKRFGF